MLSSHIITPFRAETIRFIRYTCLRELKIKMHYESSLVCNSIRCESIGHYSACSRCWHDRDPSSLVFFCHSCRAIYLCTTFYFHGKVTTCMFSGFYASKHMFTKKFSRRDRDKPARWLCILNTVLL